jgi:hypothetical protein
LGEERATEIEFAADVSVKAVFEVLSDDFSKDELFGEILGAHADARFVAAGRE